MRIHKWKVQADWGHLLFATIILIASVWYFFDARQASNSPYNLIMIAPCVAAIVVVYIITLVLEIRISHIDSAPASPERVVMDWLDPASVRNVTMMALLILYVLTLEHLGFEIATFFFISLSLIMQGERRYVRVVIFAILFSTITTWLLTSLSLSPIPTVLI